MKNKPEKPQSNMDVRQYDLPESASGSRVQFLVFAASCLVLAVASIFVGVRYDLEFTANVFGTLFLSLAATYLYRAWATRPSLQSIAVGREGIVLVFTDHETTHPWTDFVHAVVTKSAMTSEPMLLLYDITGRPAIRVPGEFDEFDTLCAVVLERIQAARLTAEQRVRLKRHWLLAAKFLLLGFPLTVGFGYLAWWTLLELFELLRRAESNFEIVQFVLVLVCWLFGFCMAVVFVAAGLLHLARLEIVRNTKGFEFVIRREPEY